MTYALVADRREEYSESDCESESTHLTVDDDLRSVQGDADLEDEASGALFDSLAENIEMASHKTLDHRFITHQTSKISLGRPLKSRTTTLMLKKSQLTQLAYLWCCLTLLLRKTSAFA